MHTANRASSLGSLSAVLLASLLLPWSLAAQEPLVERGRALYVEHCEICHGPEGRGDGPRSLSLGVKPRDFSSGAFKCRSTPTGSAPTDADLRRVIENGVRGTPMTGFERKLEGGDVEALIAHLETLAPALADRDDMLVLDLPMTPGLTAAMAREGRVLYGLLRCWNCHGTDGKGQGPAAAALVDDWGEPIRVYDFTSGRRYKCGGEDEDLYRLLHTGMTGSPMPSFTTALAFGAEEVGDPAALESTLGAAIVSELADWLATQPRSEELREISEEERRALVETRTWSLIAYLRSLQP